MTDQSSDGERSGAARLRELSALVAASSDPLCVIDAGGRCVAASRALLEALGRHRDELLGHGIAEPGMRDSLGSLLTPLLERTASGASACEHRWWDFSSWGLRYVEIALDAIEDAQGAHAGTLVRLRDVTDARLARDALEESERRFEDFAGIGDGWLWELNAELRFVYLSRSFEELMDLPRSEVLGRRRAEAFAEEDLAAADTRAHLRDLEKRRAFRDYRLTRRLRDGSHRILHLSGRPAHDAQGRFLGYRGVARDVTERERLAARAAESEIQDDLTRLLNRAAFVQRLGRVLDTATGDASEHGLCYLDIDRFRLVNERGGHAAGDALLRALADILREQVRKRDSLARTGDDEFAILVEHCSREQLQRVAHAVRRAIRDYRLLLEHEALAVSVSIGLVSIDGSMRGVDEVLRAADQACRAAKARGRNHIHIHHPEDDDSGWRRDERLWAARIERALDEQRMQLCLQPVVPMDDRGDAGESYELLMRLRDEVDDIVTPDAFLAAAERYHLCERLDRWVVSTAITWLTERPELTRRLDACFINLSLHSILEDGFLRFVTDELRSSPVQPRKICFEAPESAVLANLDGARRFVSAVTQMGCRFSLDRFAGGGASLTRLRSLPVDFVKIDGGLVKQMAASALDLAMVKSINDMGHVLGRKTVAGFVENDALLSKVRELGVDYAQGYALGRPRALQEA